jgi:D-3-phosphoglycerate dehydrogenase
LVPEHDGWIIGDDPATAEVLSAGKKGRLKAAVKWGVGVDNVDFEACKRLGIPITNTPDMFGNEVADMAFAYMIALARETFMIDRGVRNGKWLKPAGISLAGRTVALVGYGDVGRNLAKRLSVAGMNINIYDPAVMEVNEEDIALHHWPDKVGDADFIVLACGLTKSNYHIINKRLLENVKPGVRIVNVARGPLIDESALVAGLQDGKVFSAALDVFENEPLPINSELLGFERCVFGSHNASNTSDAVLRTSRQAIETLLKYLES